LREERSMLLRRPSRLISGMKQSMLPTSKFSRIRIELRLFIARCRCAMFSLREMLRSNSRGESRKHRPRLIDSGLSSRETL